MELVPIIAFLSIVFVQLVSCVPTLCLVCIYLFSVQLNCVQPSRLFVCLFVFLSNFSKYFSQLCPYTVPAYFPFHLFVYRQLVVLLHCFWPPLYLFIYLYPVSMHCFWPPVIHLFILLSPYSVLLASYFLMFVFICLFCFQFTVPLHCFWPHSFSFFQCEQILISFFFNMTLLV